MVVQCPLPSRHQTRLDWLAERISYIPEGPDAKYRVRYAILLSPVMHLHPRRALDLDSFATARAHASLAVGPTSGMPKLPLSRSSAGHCQWKSGLFLDPFVFSLFCCSLASDATFFKLALESVCACVFTIDRIWKTIRTMQMLRDKVVLFIA